MIKKKRGVAFQTIVEAIIAIAIIIFFIPVIYNLITTGRFAILASGTGTGEDNFKPYETKLTTDEQKVLDSMNALVCAINIVSSDADLSMYKCDYSQGGVEEGEEGPESTGEGTSEANQPESGQGTSKEEEAAKETPPKEGTDTAQEGTEGEFIPAE